MRLISLAVVLLLSLTIAPREAEAQQRATIARVGYFGVSSPSMSTATAQFSAFREGLRELGWLEGQNVLIETRWGEGKTEEFPRIASEFVALPVDVIVTSGPEAIRAVQLKKGEADMAFLLEGPNAETLLLASTSPSSWPTCPTSYARR